MIMEERVNISKPTVFRFASPWGHFSDLMIVSSIIMKWELPCLY